MNALSDANVAAYLHDRVVATYLKVGTFQIVGNRKIGGNVASYFCLPDGTVLHAVVGPANGSKFLSEARWAWEIRKTALTHATDLATGVVAADRLRREITKAHEERFAASVMNSQLAGRLRAATAEHGKPGLGVSRADLPRHANQQAQVHWLLATRSLAPIDEIYPIVWQEILREQLSSLPVAMQ